jgi:hypothetical protein
VTGLPLLLFTHGAKRLHHGHHRLPAVHRAQLHVPAGDPGLPRTAAAGAASWTFILIWSALALYSWDAVRALSEKVLATDLH